MVNSRLFQTFPLPQFAIRALLLWQTSSVAIAQVGSNYLQAGVSHYQLLAVSLVLISLLIFRLIRWDSKLKKTFKNRFNDEIVKQQDNASRKTMQYTYLIFVAIIAIVLLALSLNYSYYNQKDHILVRLTEVILLAVAMLSSYLLGSMQRRQEADGYFSQLLKQIVKREKIEKRLSDSEQRLAHQQESLSKLTQDQLRNWQNPQEIFKEIAEISAKTLDVERVSVWLFAKNKQRLDCQVLYIKSSNKFISSKPLEAKQLPIYFSHLAQHRVITADDAMQHPATQEFTLGYLQENNVTSLLDGTVWLNNEVIGVICHEHVGKPRKWTLDEQNFAGSLADLVRLTIETDRRRSAEDTLIKYNNDLEKLVDQRTQALLESESTFRYVVQHAPIPILIINKDTKITEFNPEAESATGYTKAQALGKNFIELLVDKPSRKTALQMSLKTLKGQDFRGVELILLRADGTKVEFECSASLAGFDAATGARQIVAIGRDISQQKALERSLVRARESAESADRIKSMFVASMSHELRTPLNSIIGFLGVVLQGMSGDLNLKQKDQLGRAYHSAKHLLSLISDVIDISKIEAGFLETHKESFLLKPLLIEVEQAVQHLITDKHLGFKIDCAKNLKLESDRKRLYQVVLNIVSNAVKYTEQGEVEVTAKAKADSVIITVRDTGIGIDEAGLKKLFQPFERIDSPLKIKTLGTGLGLYLTRKILTQLLGGTVSVDSLPNQGSVFSVSIPKKPQILVPTQTSSVLD